MLRVAAERRPGDVVDGPDLTVDRHDVGGVLDDLYGQHVPRSLVLYRELGANSAATLP